MVKTTVSALKLNLKIPTVLGSLLRKRTARLLLRPCPSFARNGTRVSSDARSALLVQTDRSRGSSRTRRCSLNRSRSTTRCAGCPRRANSTSSCRCGQRRQAHRASGSRQRAGRDYFHCSQ